MGSLLSTILVCIYFKLLESGPFKYIIPSSASYFICIDNILLIYPQDLNLNSITDGRNNVEPSVKFTYALEYNTLPFLGCLTYKEQ